MADITRTPVECGKEELMKFEYTRSSLVQQCRYLNQNVKTCDQLKEGVSVKSMDLHKTLFYLVETLTQTDIQNFHFLRFVFELLMKENFIDKLCDVLKLINYWREKNEEKNNKYDDLNYFTNQQHSHHFILNDWINLQSFKLDAYLKLFSMIAKSVEHDTTTGCVNNASIPKYINNRKSEDKSECKQFEVTSSADTKNINNRKREDKSECKQYEVTSSADTKKKSQYKSEMKEDSFLVVAPLKESFRKTEKKIQCGKLNGKVSGLKSNGCPDVDKLEDDYNKYLNIVLRHQHVPVPPVKITVFMQPSFHPNGILDIPWDMFNREVCRLQTFASYPADAVKSALLLANAGFVYIGIGQGSDDRVKCYFCCGEKRNWGLLDEIHEMHRRISPNCAMVTGVGCDNIPLSLSLTSRPINTSTSLTSCPVYPNNTSEIAASNNGDVWSTLQTDSVLDITQPTADTRQHEFQFRKSQNDDRERTQANENSSYSLTDHSDARFNTQTGHTGNFLTRAASYNFEQTNPPAQTSDSNSIVPPRFSNASLPFVETVSNTQTLRHDLNATTTPALPPSTQPPISSVANLSSILATTVTEPEISATLTNVSQGAAAAEVTDQAVPTLPLSKATNEANINPNNGPTGGQTSGPMVGLTGGPAGGPTGGQTNGQGSGSKKTPTYSELGIITERPKRTEYARKQARIETFGNWPRDHHLTPADLAEAGFYYAGYGDCARCFFCGGGLRNWDDEDDVWVEHARWFPKCAYIRQQRGQFFVDTVQELNKSFSVIPLERVLAITRQSAFPTLEPNRSLMSEDPAVITVQQLGYAEKDVLRAALLVKEELTIVSSDAILERLDKDRKEKVNPPNAILPISSSNPKADLEMIQRLKEKNNQLRQQTVCKICMDKEVAVVFLPCGHLVSCADCASAMKDCPYCRQNIKGIVRTFIT